MKKIFAFTIALVLLMFPVTAFAQGRITVTGAPHFEEWSFSGNRETGNYRVWANYQFYFEAENVPRNYCWFNAWLQSATVIGASANTLGLREHETRAWFEYTDSGQRVLGAYIEIYPVRESWFSTMANTTHSIAVELGCMCCSFSPEITIPVRIPSRAGMQATPRVGVGEQNNLPNSVIPWVDAFFLLSTWGVDAGQYYPGVYSLYRRAGEWHWGDAPSGMTFHGVGIESDGTGSLEMSFGGTPRGMHSLAVRYLIPADAPNTRIFVDDGTFSLFVRSPETSTPPSTPLYLLRRQRAIQVAGTLSARLSPVRVPGYIPPVATDDESPDMYDYCDDCFCDDYDYCDNYDCSCDDDWDDDWDIWDDWDDDFCDCVYDCDDCFDADCCCDEHDDYDPAAHVVFYMESDVIYCLLTGEEIIMDVAPFVTDGRTLLPVRFMAYALGADIDWDDDTQEVTLTVNGDALTFAIGEAAPGMDVPAQIIDARTMVPLRFIGEFFGAEVIWCDSTESVEIILQ
ncbi:MAG: copper amine oxidase N-terminal domain-containing protein [Defluviitaleaceae bacterium]|nr:copper amine oxidase N-terminal domain-containing protein [Defluviitaleaceae bacterium]